jgi:hypothetical protein
LGGVCFDLERGHFSKTYFSKARQMAAEWVKLADAALVPTADGMI